METITETLTPEEARELQEFREYKARKAQEEQDRKLREQYARMVDDEVASAVTELMQLSEEIQTVKERVFDNFSAVISLKLDTLGLGKEGGQYSHTFTSSDSTRRITLGNYTIDNYRDTVEEGIRLVREYIQSLAKDDDSSALVDAVLKLLSRNKKGQIQASRVLQLRKLAERSQDPTFLRGVRIIEESYQPSESASYVRCEIKDAETGKWHSVPLSMTSI